MPLRRPAAGHLPVVASAAVSWHQTQRCFRRDGAQIAGPDAVNATSCPAPAARSEPLGTAPSAPSRSSRSVFARTATVWRAGTETDTNQDKGPLRPGTPRPRTRSFVYSYPLSANTSPRRACSGTLSSTFGPPCGHADSQRGSAFAGAQVPGLSALPARAPSFAYREDAETPGYKAKGTARPCERLRGSVKSAGCRLPPRRHSSAACSLLKCL